MGVTTRTEPVHAAQGNAEARTQFSLVVVGHVDHGKSTVIGRLLADTGSLPEGRLEAVRAQCAATSRPFEYAFLLDALENERRQGITIDTARCFFKGAHRDYLIIDAPGHIEFLKNMISGAARAEAAVLVIDAKEGVRENSRRHGYMLSLLGIRQVVVLVNKMDLVDYRQDAFLAIEDEYRDFLAKIGVSPRAFVPAAAFHGENLTAPSSAMAWYRGHPLLGEIDRFAKEAELAATPLRLPVQDVYKFTEAGDDRRITVGRVEAGVLRVGDEVRFWPSGKEARVKTIEAFNTPPPLQAVCGASTGITLEPEIYVQPGEVMARRSEAQPTASRRFRANIFWMGRNPLVPGKKYKLKLATAEVPVWVERINQVLDASDLSSGAKAQVELHDVADCVLETFKPLAFDLAADCAPTGRFVLVDNYEIAGGGIILAAEEDGSRLLEAHLRTRERDWERSALTPGLRAGRYNQNSTFLVLAGLDGTSLGALGRSLEELLFRQGRYVYFLGLANTMQGLHSDGDRSDRADLIHRLGETAHLFTDAGAIIIAAVPGLDRPELEVLKGLVRPHSTLVVSHGAHHLPGSDIDLALATGTGSEDPVTTLTQGDNLTRIASFLADRTVLLDYVL